jgi:signal transduction histidine kinase
MKMQLLFDADIAGIAHDMRGPLTMVQAAFSLLDSHSGTASSGSRQDLTDAIRAGCSRLDDFSKLILQLTSERWMQSHAGRQGVELNRLVETLVESLKPLYPEKHENIELHLAPQANYLETNSRPSLERLLWNLFTNACRMSAKDGPIEIISGVKGKDIFVSVSDSGPGMPEDLITFLCSAETDQLPFFPTSQSPILGSGVGTYVIRKTLTILGAKIHITPNKDQGTKITVIFPVNSTP